MSAVRPNISPASYVRAVHGAGGRAVLLPPDPEDAQDPGGVLGLIDALIVTGGAGDLDPSLYDQQPHPETGPIQEQRDTYELAPVRAAIGREVPTLGVYRGMQVINTASFVATMGAATSQVSYTASEGGVFAMSRELGAQFARRGVRMNALCPGPVNTPLLQELFAKDPEKAARRLAHLPTGRFAEAAEIANAALFLASDESSYVTASAFLVDGGLTSAYVTPVEFSSVELSEEGLRPLDAGQP